MNSKLTEKQRTELKALEAISDDDIDLSDILESLDWSDVIHNAYRLLKKGAPLPRRSQDQGT